MKTVGSLLSAAGRRLPAFGFSFIHTEARAAHVEDVSPDEMMKRMQAAG